MPFLLDTNVIIWLALEPVRVPARVKAELESGAVNKWVSVVSAWEYGQKRKLRPQELPFAFDSLTAEMACEFLSFDYELRRHAESLPLIHKDPFDRMLIAQALQHGLTLVTPDSDIRKYPIKSLW